MLDVLLCLVCLAALCLFFASLRGVSSASAPLLALCLAMLWFAGFGMAGLLRLGGWLFYVGSLALGGVAFWFGGKTKLLKKLLTPGLLLFFAGAILLAVWLNLKQPLFTQWDEFTFWGTAAKMTKTTNVLYPVADSGLRWTLTEYPALVMLSYFAQFFGAFAEWKVYWAYGLLYFACVAAMLAPFGRRQWRIATPLALCGLAVPFFFAVRYETVELATAWLSSYADIPGGMLFGGTLCVYFAVRQSRKGALWQVLLPLATLAIVKENITPVALVAAGVFAMDVLVFGTRPAGLSPLAAAPKDKAAKRKRRPRRFLARLGWAAGWFAAVLAPYLAWKQYAQWANTLNTYMNGNQTNDVSPVESGLQALREVFGLAPMSDVAKSTAGELLNSFLGRVPVEGGYEYGTLRASMAGTGLITLLLIVGIFAVAVLLARNWSQKGRMALCGGLLLGGFAAYHLMLFASYAYMSHTRTEGIFDYPRYTATYTAGWLLLGLMLLGLAAKWAGRQRGLMGRTAVLALAVFMLVRPAMYLRPGYSVLDTPKTTWATQRQRQETAATYAAAIQPGGRVFFVSQTDVDGGGLYFQWHYDLYPTAILEYSITGGGPLVPRPEGEPEADYYAGLERIEAYLAEYGCDYILIQSVDEGFVENYGTLFDGLDAAAETPALYQKTADGLYARVEV